MRSGRTFLLMLVNVGDLLQGDPSDHVRSEIVSALTDCTRETDIVGWYREGVSLGVIFTDIQMLDGHAPEGVLCAKVGDALRATLGGEKIKHIQIKFVVLPEAWEIANRRLPSTVASEIEPAYIAEPS